MKLLSLGHLRNNDRAVSSVVGVVIMVAIAVILVTSVSGLLLTTGDQVEKDQPKDAVVYVEQTDTNADLKFEDVDTNYLVTLSKNGEELRTIKPAPGDTYRVENLSDGDIIRGTSQTNGKSYIVFEYTVSSKSPKILPTITNTNDPVTEGETLNVDVTVENAGSEYGEQTIELVDFNGNVVDTKTVSLNPGERKSFTMSWSTSTGDAATDDVVVRSEDGTAAQEVTIQGPANFKVGIVGSNSPVVEGDILSVGMKVENTGGSTDTQTIELLDFNGNVVDSTSVTLAPGESKNVGLGWSTSNGDAGTGSITGRSEDTSDTQQVTIKEPAYFDVTITGTNEPVDEGNTLRVDATIENIGGTSDTQTIRLYDIYGNQVDSTTISLNSGSATQITLRWYTQSGDDGSGDVVVESYDSSDSEPVTINNDFNWGGGGGIPGFAFPFVVLAMYLSKLFKTEKE